jgi:transposase
MMIIGCDFHPSWQQVSWLDTETGDNGEQKLVQAAGDAERFYRQAPAPALIGMEATGNCHWLVDLLAEPGHELWVGDAAQIRASCVRQQKTDKRDAAHLLQLLVEGRLRSNRWLVERLHRRVIQREISRVLVLNLSGKASGACAPPRTTTS